ncbi:MAG TPA: efflux RND transporter periplasmic adaptor subunit [Acidobacteriota bacterium]|nr:efflux RND transporter periplasmic adaptor subunit [Acidobacteriota bacterium]
MRKIILPLVALLILTFGIISVVRSQPKRVATVPFSPPPVSPYEHTVAAVGLVETSTENIAIGTPLSDVVAEVYVTAGQSVQKGDPLFKLDVRQLVSDLIARKARLQVAESQVKVDSAVVDDVTRELEFAESVGDSRAISEEEVTHRRSAVETAQARLHQAEAEIEAARAEIKLVETQLERSVVRAPMSGVILQVKIHPGEFAQAGVNSTPLILLGRLKPLYIRVDVDEHETWRVRPDAKATAEVRGNSDLKTALKFVRFEPFVVPKKSLTGDSTERVDTRVLQVIYEVENESLPLFVGQQMDVFIESQDSKTHE